MRTTPARNAPKGQAEDDAVEGDQEARLEALESQQQAPAAPAPTAAGDDEMVTKLTNLKGLLDSGVLTQAEFDAAKAKVLAGG